MNDGAEPRYNQPQFEMLVPIPISGPVRRPPWPPSVRRGSIVSQWFFVLFCLMWPASAPLIAIETGTLEVSSNAGAEVFWEGVSLGETDEAGRMEISGIPPGEYEIKIRGSGRRSRDFEVDVGSGLNRFADPRLRYGNDRLAGAGIVSPAVESTGTDTPAAEGGGPHALPAGAATALADGAKASSLPFLVAVAVASVLVLLIYFRDPRHFGRSFATASSSSGSPRGSAGASGPDRRVVEVVDVEVRRVQDSESRHGRG